MMHARMMAVTRGHEHYVVLGNTAYSVVEDTSDSGSRDSCDRTLPDFPKKASLSWNNTANDVTLDKRGIMPKWRTIRAASATDAYYNCVAVSTRTIMSRYVNDKCQPK